MEVMSMKVRRATSDNLEFYAFYTGPSQEVLASFARQLDSLIIFGTLTDSLKCTYNNSSNQSETCILYDPGSIIARLTATIEHPVGQLVHQACHAQLQAHGTGATSLLCLATCWLQQAEMLMDEGIPAPVVLALMEEAISICQRTLCSLAVPLKQLAKQEQSNRPVVQKVAKQVNSPGTAFVTHRALMFSRHFGPQTQAGGNLVTQYATISLPDLLRTLQKLSHGRELAMDLALQVFKLQNKGAFCDLSDLRCWSLDKEAVVMKEMVGFGGDQCEVMEGLLCKVDCRQSHLLTGEQPHSLLVVGSCAISQITTGSVNVVCSLSSYCTEDMWLEEIMKQLKRLGVSVLATEGTMHHLLIDACFSHGIVVLFGLSHCQLINLCAVTGGKVVHNLQTASSNDLGSCELLEGTWRVKRGCFPGEHCSHAPAYCLIKAVGKHTKVVSVVLSGRTIDNVNGLKHTTSQALIQLKCVLHDSSLLPGGGYSEVACANSLTRLGCDTTGDHQSVLKLSSSWMTSLMDECRAGVYRAVAEGLLQYAVVVVQNCSPGISVHEARSKVEEMKTQGVQLEVLDQLSGKLECLKNATVLVRLLLNSSQC